MKELICEEITNEILAIKHFPASDNIKVLATKLEKGNLIIIRNALSSDYCSDVVEYLSTLRTATIPKYESLNKKAPNHFRINHEDGRSSVKGYFEQFNFFMHNQDLLNLFEETKHIFELKDNLSYFMAKGKIKYNSLNPPEDFITRLGFQFYPIGKGYLEEHSDYVGENQLVVPTIILSKRGKDYLSGGFYCKDKNDKIVDPEPYVNIGDIILFNPTLSHGVATIAKDNRYNWKSSNGRWMAFATTTKTT